MTSFRIIISFHNKSLLILYIFVWIYLLMPSIALAQYRFDQWTTDTGLPQNSVHDILQTHDGYLWLATLDGLVRFDGVRFTVFNKSNSPGISSNRFLSLREDDRNDLWATTEDGGVVRYHQGNLNSYGIEPGIENPHAVALFIDDD